MRYTMIENRSIRALIYAIAFLGFIIPSKGNARSEADFLGRLERGFTSFSDSACTKLPSPDPKPEDEKLRFNDFRQSVDFLKALSTYVYSFDREYLLEMAATIEKSDHPDLVSIFIMNAMEPYFAQFGYSAIKDRYITVALENLKCLNGNFGIADLSSLKNIQIFQEAAVRFLISSFKTALTMMSESQKAKAHELIAVFGDSLAQGLNEKTLALVRSRLGDAQKLSFESVVNPFLKSRAVAETLVEKYLGE